MSNETDAAFLHDLAGRMYRTVTPAMGFDQHDTDQLHRIARDLATPAPDSEKLREAKEAFQALLDTHDEDQDMDDFPDDDSVGAYQSEGGEVRDMPLTFGILRRARRALAALGATS